MHDNHQNLRADADRGCRSSQCGQARFRRHDSLPRIPALCLAGAGSRDPARSVLETHSYVGARDMSCCQANGNRGISQIAEWAILSDRNDVYVNYYGECALETALDNGHRFVLTQQTDYPAGGAVNIKIDTACPDELTLHFRIPSWSVNIVLTVNGEAVEAAPGSYCAVSRVWKTGDEVRLELDMSPHFLVNDTRKPAETSVYYGPLLLAFRTGSGATRSTRFNADAFTGLVLEEGEGLVNFSVETASGRKVTFTDYYTAGKNGDAFTSWIRCSADGPFILSSEIILQN